MKSLAVIQQELSLSREAEIRALVPVARRLAIKAGPAGIVFGDVRLAANLAHSRGPQRSLSYGCQVCRAAGLVRNGRYRVSPTGNRNRQAEWVLPVFAERNES